MRFFVHSSPAFYGLFTFFCEVRVLLRTQYFERRDVRSILDKTSFCVWLFVLLSLHQSPVDQRIKVNLGEWCWIDSTLLVFTKKDLISRFQPEYFLILSIVAALLPILLQKFATFNENPPTKKKRGYYQYHHHHTQGSDRSTVSFHFVSYGFLRHSVYWPLSILFHVKLQAFFLNLSSLFLFLPHKQKLQLDSVPQVGVELIMISTYWHLYCPLYPFNQFIHVQLINQQYIYKYLYT